MPTRTALIIDDEQQIRRVVRHALADDFARVREAETGERGVDLAAAEKPAMIVLDLGLPDVPGVQVCTEIRKWSDAAILVLSARHSDQEKVALLDAGADDYVTKPFSTIELKARVRALLRRSAGRAANGATTISCGELKIDLDARTLTRSGALVHLTPMAVSSAQRSRSPRSSSSIGSSFPRTTPCWFAIRSTGSSSLHFS